MHDGTERGSVAGGGNEISTGNKKRETKESLFVF